ncbi:Regulator of chromosome condensation family protein [Metarhizium acridum CQMa 102]|uniref:Regulator of chromosome condensation family protein n=1 Tax=Metarhizium acridum (strain CQMa 102) TaxID=655827 RepID=E9EE20_METAQ|nr:Regulator of chromosome condensation family protein [Metarhizium acridum CQMa 102]EFY85859.1 Regulator of chromosome condensation family protein [Metarhizium acridum CQMa 102]
MPSVSALSERKIRDREQRSKRMDMVPRTGRTTQNISALNAKPSNVRSTAAGRKRSLEMINDHQVSTATPDIPKRVKTGSVRSKKPSKLATINNVPTVKLTLLIFGGGENGELGLGPKNNEATRPTRNPHLSAFDIVQVACGGMHTVALTSDNKIITWGVNDENALGRDTQWDGKLRDIDTASDDDDNGDMNPLESTPTQIPSDYFPSSVRFVQVAAGDSCSFALTDTGHVYGWGTFRDSRGEKGFRYDERGELVKNQATPVQIQNLQDIRQICCGVDHALALDIRGNIWARGFRVCRNKAKYVASGSYHSFAIDKNDNVWAWGANSFGEAGDAKTAGNRGAFITPTKINSLCQKKVLALDGGAHHSAAVTANGECFVWGRIIEGQLGIDFAPEQLRDSTLIRFDERDKPCICLRPTIIPTTQHQQVTHVACGSDHTILIDQPGNAYSTGYGFQGQLGLNSNDDVKVFQRITDRRIKDKLIWAGAGGQFSIVAESANVS